jgi:hypothetical protein
MMLSCKEATRLVSEKLDRELPFRQRLGLRLHVLMCRGCSWYARQVTMLDRVVGEHYRYGQTVEKAAQLSEEIRQRIKASLRAATSD